MPEGEEEGIEILKKIGKANLKSQVVMITAVGQDTILKECKKAGASDYIIKPFDAKKVISTVEKYLG